MPSLTDQREEDAGLLVAAEETIANAAIDAVNGLARQLRSALRDERLTDSEMASLKAHWETSLDDHLLPAIEQVYAEAYDWQVDALTAATKRVSAEALANARDYVKSIRNRLVGVADEIFSDIQRELAQGMEANEDPDQLARRIDRVFAERGGNNWLGRASVIAQTETAAAINAGRMQSARKYARDHDLRPSSIRKTWITQQDDRVRETHQKVHGKTLPLTTDFVVGGAKMSQPGDPKGPPQETIQCRCTIRFALPNRTASGGPMDETAEVVPWYGILAPEGVMSGDRRKFAEGSLRHRDLPLPLMYQEATQPGHDGAVRVGRIDGMQRATDENGTTVMRGWGVMDTHETAKEATRQLDQKMLRGVSVDVDDITVEFENEDGSPMKDPLEAMLEGEDIEEPVMVLSDGRVSGATLCSIPAFQEAFISLGQPPEDWGVSVESGADEELVGIEAVIDLEEYATVSDKPWSDFTESDYSDEQWYRACALHKNGDSKVKSDNGLPIREPNGTLNRNGVHAAAARFNQVDAPADAKAKAKATLRGAYKTLGEEVPDALAGTQAPAFLAASAMVASGSVADFDNPGLTRETALTVTEDGRVFGHLATWGTCHIGFDGACVTPPTSHTGYAYFRTGEVLTADGSSVPVGHITMGTGHADATLGSRPAAEHYDNTGCVVADVAAGDDEYGIWVAGRVRPSATKEQVDTLRAAALSGDWRRIGGNLELVAALAVNVPGFPIPRARVSLAAGAQVSLVASGIVQTNGRQVMPTTAEIKAMLTEVLREDRKHQARIERAERIAASIQRDRLSRAAAAGRLVHG